MANANDMINVTQGELEQFVCEDTGSICEPKQTVIGEDSAQAHGTGMQYSLMT